MLCSAVPCCSVLFSAVLPTQKREEVGFCWSEDSMEGGRGVRFGREELCVF